MKKPLATGTKVLIVLLAILIVLGAAAGITVAVFRSSGVHIWGNFLAVDAEVPCCIYDPVAETFLADSTLHADFWSHAKADGHVNTLHGDFTIDGYPVPADEFPLTGLDNEFYSTASIAFCWQDQAGSGWFAVMSQPIVYHHYTVGSGADLSGAGDTQTPYQNMLYITKSDSAHLFVRITPTQTADDGNVGTAGTSLLALTGFASHAEALQYLQETEIGRAMVRTAVDGSAILPVS